MGYMIMPPYTLHLKNTGILLGNKKIKQTAFCKNYWVTISVLYWQWFILALHLVRALVFRWWCFLKSAECKLLQLSTRLTTCFWDKLFKLEKIIRSQYCKYPQFTLIWPVPYWVQQLSPWRSSCSKVTNTRKIESMKVKTVLIWMSLLPVSV